MLAGALVLTAWHIVVDYWLASWLETDGRRRCRATHRGLCFDALFVSISRLLHITHWRQQQSG